MAYPPENDQHFIHDDSAFGQKIAVDTGKVLDHMIRYVSIIACFALIADILFYQKKMGSFFLIAALLITILIAKLLLKRRKVRQAAILSVTAGWLITAAAVFIGGGLESAFVVFFVSLTVIAGLLLGKRAVLFSAAASAALGIGLALLSLYGYLPAPYFLHSPLTDLTLLIFGLFLAACALNLVLHDRDKSLNMANRQLAERSKTEEKFRENAEIHSKLISVMPDILVRMNLQGKILYVNDAALLIGNYELKEMVGENMLKFIAPEDHEMAIKNTLLMFEKKLGPQRYHLVMKDGTKLLFEVNGDVLKNEDGTPCGLFQLCRNINDRFLAEEALQKSEERYRSLVENADEAILVIQDGMIRFANSRVMAAFGYSDNEIMSVPVFELVHPEDRDEVARRYLEKISGDKSPTRHTYRVISKNGQTSWIEVGSVLIDWEGRPATLNMITDITKHIQAEEDKKAIEERLRRAEKMQALGQLAGGVAHDLNNVLGVLSGYSELLMMEVPEGQRGRVHVEKILQSTEKGAAIIQDLLTLARRGVTTSEVVHINSVVSDFLKTPMFEKIKDYHPLVNFRTDLQEDLLYIKGSPIHLEKTLLNLIMNGAESISGRGEITIRTMNRYLDKTVTGFDNVREGDYSLLTVSDTGSGIPPEHLEKIFEPFYTKKTMGRSGTGLGLAIVWGTVKDHNGYIDVRSKIGEGTTFTLFFPVTREKPAEASQKEPLEGYMGNGERVLVVDDVPEQREVATGLLASLNYRVHAVSCGEEAVEYLRSNHADILVLDMIMIPGIDGLETYRRVLEVKPGQKAILVSGFSETDRVLDAQKLGAGAYVKKPYLLEKIGIAVREELKRL